MSDRMRALREKIRERASVTTEAGGVESYDEEAKRGTAEAPPSAEELHAEEALTENLSDEGQEDVQVELPPDIDPDVNENLRDAMMTQDQVRIAISAIVNEFTKKLAGVESRVDKLRLTLEMQEATGKVGKPRPSGIEIIAVQHGPIDHQGRLVQVHLGKVKGKEVLFANNRPDIRSLRRSQGWEPVLDDNGNEVRYIDGVMMTMSPEKFQEEITKPKERRKALRRKSIATHFRDRAKGQKGIEPFGDITYDEGKD